MFRFEIRTLFKAIHLWPSAGIPFPRSMNSYLIIIIIVLCLFQNSPMSPDKDFGILKYSYHYNFVHPIIDHSRFRVNTLRPRQNGCHFPDDSFRCIFLNENVWIYSKFSLKFVPKGSFNNIPTLVQIMAWRRPGDKPLSESAMVSLLTHICVTRPQWVKLILFLKLYMPNAQRICHSDQFRWRSFYTQSNNHLLYFLAQLSLPTVLAYALSNMVIN